MTIRVGVFGAGGRMGGEVCRAVNAVDDMALVAAVDPAAAGQELGTVAGIPGTDLVVSEEPEALLDGEAEVAVDFTEATAAFKKAQWCIRHAMHAVIGTTGISEDHIRNLEHLMGDWQHEVRTTIIERRSYPKRAPATE